jgi:hypothetical protein
MPGFRSVAIDGGLIARWNYRIRASIDDVPIRQQGINVYAGMATSGPDFS